MIISNKNGSFEVSAPQFNFLYRNFNYDEINKELVVVTSFIKSSFDYKRAHETVIKHMNKKNKSILKTVKNLHNLGFGDSTTFFSKRWKKKDMRLHQILFDCDAPECFSALNADTLELYIYFENLGTKEDPYFYKIGILPKEYIKAYEFYTKAELNVLKIISEHDPNIRFTILEFESKMKQYQK